MSDLISRQQAIETLKEYEVVESDNFTRTDPVSMMAVATIADCIEAIAELPSVQPERKWIPVAEALPENDDWVIVSIYDDDGDTSWQYTTPGFYVPYGKCWIVDNEYCRNVIAWMPLPESYKGDNQ